MANQIKNLRSFVVGCISINTFLATSFDRLTFKNNIKPPLTIAFLLKKNQTSLKQNKKTNKIIKKCVPVVLGSIERIAERCKGSFINYSVITFCFCMYYSNRESKKKRNILNIGWRIICEDGGQFCAPSRYHITLEWQKRFVGNEYIYTHNR